MSQHRILSPSQTTESILSRISKASYNGQLRKNLVIHSINCKEWEAEKEFFVQNLVELDAESFDKANFAATRWYVELSGPEQNSNAPHRHMGHMDIRPISPTISDAFLPIPKKTNFYVTCQKIYKSDDFSNPGIRTVPYITPDQRLSWCAPASMWILLSVLSNELGKQHLSLYEIVRNLPNMDGKKAIEVRDFDRLIEKLGYSHYYYYGKCQQELYDEVGKDFEDGRCKSECKLKPLYDHIWKENKYKNVMDWSVLYAYIESEIPVYLVFRYKDLVNIPGYPIAEHDNEGQLEDNACHAVVAIGHTQNESGEIDNFIIHDVSASPFITVPRELIDTYLLEAIVLLPKDTYHYNFVRHLLAKVVKNIAQFDNDIHEIVASGKIVYRAYLMRSQRVKFWFADKSKYHKVITTIFSKADIPKYVWVFEISSPTLKESDHSIGCIIFDASISNKNPNPILITLPKFMLWYERGERKMKVCDTPIYNSMPLFRSPPNEER